MVLRMKNFNIFGLTEKSNFQGAGSRKTNIEAKMVGAWTVSWFKGGAWQERGGGVLEGVDTPMHTMSYPKIIWHVS